MRIAFIVGEFPALSETFILDQITGLIERGHDVDIFAEKARKESKVHGDFTKFNLAKKTHYRPPMPGNKLLRLLKGIFLAAIVFPKEPKVLFNSLNFLSKAFPVINVISFSSNLSFRNTKVSVLDFLPSSFTDRKSTRLNSSHIPLSRMPSSA